MTTMTAATFARNLQPGTMSEIRDRARTAGVTITPDQERALSGADRNHDGIIGNSAAERRAAWRAVDDFDHNGTRRSVSSTTGTGHDLARVLAPSAPATGGATAPRAGAGATGASGGTGAGATGASGGTGAAATGAGATGSGATGSGATTTPPRADAAPRAATPRTPSTPRGASATPTPPRAPRTVEATPPTPRAEPTPADRLRDTTRQLDQIRDLVRSGRVTPDSAAGRQITGLMEGIRGTTIPLTSFDDPDYGEAHADFLRAQGDLLQAGRERGFIH